MPVALMIRAIKSGTRTTFFPLLKIASDIGGFMGLPPTGKRFTLPIVFLLVVRDGRIQYERRIYDFTGLLIQLGVLKAKPA